MTKQDAIDHYGGVRELAQALGVSPPAIYRFNRFVAATVSGSPAPGYTLGQAIAALEDCAAELAAGLETPNSVQSVRKTMAHAMRAIARANSAAKKLVTTSTRHSRSTSADS